MSYGDYLDVALGGQTLYLGMFGGGKIVIINERSLERERERERGKKEKQISVQIEI